MKPNDRVKSPVNTGTVKSVSETTVEIHWDGFAWSTIIPATLAATFDVVSPKSGLTRDEEYEGYCDGEAARRLGD